MHPRNTHVKDSKHRLKEVISNGEHLKLKATVESVMNKLMSTPSSSHGFQSSMPNIPRNKDDISQGSFPPEPGENRDGIDFNSIKPMVSK